MAEARVLSRPRLIWRDIKDFSAAHIINRAGDLMFLLLASFVLWPIISVLVKSIFGPTGFTLEYYKDFINSQLLLSFFF